MALRLISGDFTATHTTKVYRDTEWEEYRVVTTCKANGATVATYHSNDKEDAMSTAKAELNWATLHNVRHAARHRA